MAAHHIAFWNLENLFDVEDSPRRSAKLQRALGKELDQFLVSKGLRTGAPGLKARPDSVRVEQFPEMVDDGDYPDPIRFGRGDDANLGGYSDHYPISVVIDEDD